MDITLSQLQQMLQSAAKLGAMEVMRNTQSDLISKSECYRRFGRRWMDHQIANGTIKGKRRGSEKNSKVVFSLTDIIAIQESEMSLRTILQEK